MRIEPEHVLEEDRVAAQRRVEDPDAKDVLDPDQQERDRRIGVASTMTTLVAYMLQQNSGMRNQVIPGSASCGS
jgi:hypothetical protein